MLYKYRKISSICFFVLLLALLILYFAKVSPTHSGNSSSEEVIANSIVENDQVLSTIGKPLVRQINSPEVKEGIDRNLSEDRSDDRASTEPLTLAGTRADAAVLQNWGELRGRFSKETMTDYASYDLETLMDLSDAGDVKAMIALANLYSSPGYSSKYGLDYSLTQYQKAAVYGSSYAFERIAIALEVKKDESITMADHIEILAIKNVAALRGDYYPNMDGYSYLKRHGVTLSPADINAIKARSEALYLQLVAERHKLGLGDFDNSVPTEVKSFFSALDDKIIKY